MAKVWLNGALVDEAEPALSVHERGFLLGEAAFETMRWCDGGIRRWPRHRERLLGGLSYLGVPMPDLDQIGSAAAELANVNQIGDGVLRLTVSGGASPGFERGDGVEATLALSLRPRPVPPEAVKLAVLSGMRRAALPSSTFKLAGYADNTAARREARALNADMAVMLGADSLPVCCDVANLFWITRGGEILTPSVERGALPGTARAALLDAAGAAGIAIDCAPGKAVGLDTAVAAFVTNAVMGAVPASAIDGRPLDVEHPVLKTLVALEATAD